VKDHKIYTEANRKAWNQTMPKHQKVMREEWDKRFSKPGYICQKDPEFSELRKLQLPGKDIAHISCNNGVELMSLKNLGAAKCTGFDICDEAIAEANSRARITGFDCHFVQTDILEMSPEYYQSYDIVYVTVGALAWIPDLKKYFHVASKLLRKNGSIFIYEQHPFATVFPWDKSESDHPLKAIHHYFDDEIYQSNEGIDYIGGTTYESETSYEFTHTMSDIFTALIEAGLNIKSFKEYEDDISTCYTWQQEAGIKLPLSYILTAQKI